MKANFFPILIACFIATSVFSQANLNKYKYVIVPNRFDFLKEKDQYQLNSLSQFLFNKYGFEALMEGTVYPEDLIRNRCLALKSDVIKDSGMFKTKLSVELKDCNDQVVYTSGVGESREKEFKIAYNKALRAAFKHLEVLNYKYEPSENVTAVAISKTSETIEVSKEIQQLKQQIKNLKQEKEAELALVEAPKVEIPQPKAVEKKEVNKTDVIKGVSNIFYAQEIDNGFQLVDNSPKVIYKIKNTGLNNTFLVEDQSAIIYKKGDDWVLEYYIDNVLKQDVLNIKF
ncbi:hypothetical protein GCM10023311_09290 [Flaviramulus aquimarinus]|uniref:Secreted protein n=1 Tax=Flaviramulus aquimarinus TaxID=1170456 RepID=A0ABP9EUV5_9FLAO